MKAEQSQQEFARVMDVTTATINRYEKGHRLPDADFLDRLVINFKCDPAWLLTGESSDRRHGFRTNTKENGKTLEIIEWLEENPEAHNFLFKLVRASREIDSAVAGLKTIANKGLKVFRYNH